MFLVLPDGGEKACDLSREVAGSASGSKSEEQKIGAFGSSEEARNNKALVFLRGLCFVWCRHQTNGMFRRD
jgi:hypothetical protein